MGLTANGTVIGYDPEIVTQEDVRLAAGAALEGFDGWSQLAELAGRLSMLLPPDAFAQFFDEFVRELMDARYWGILTDLINGIQKVAPPRSLPVSPELLTDLMACSPDWVREAARDLMTRCDLRG